MMIYCQGGLSDPPIKAGWEDDMTESNDLEHEKSHGWVAVLKRVIGIAIGILVIGFLIAVFLFGDLLRTGT